MSTVQEVTDAIDEFWRREEEYLLLKPTEFIKVLPSHLLPSKNYIPPFTLTEKQWIYRARPIDASYMKGDGRYLISNYTYSPKKYTIQGRANHPNQPMFYGSEYIGATALESRWHMEKDALIGCWRVRNNSPNLKFAVCASRFRPELKVNLKDKLHASVLKQLEFLDELFSSDREKQLWTEYRRGNEVQKETPRDRIHKLSASIAQYLMKREGVDGILYLSAQAQGARAVFPPYNEADLLFNVAISPRYIKKHMVLEKVYRVRIESYEDDKGRRRATRKAIRIGLPINRTRLSFSKLNATQISEFENYHNNGGVPMLLSGPFMLKVPKPGDYAALEAIVEASECPAHKKLAVLGSEDVNGNDYTTLQICCEEFCDQLKEKLRSEGMWWD